MMPYHELPIESTITDQVLAQAHDPATQWQQYFGFLAMSLPVTLLCQDVFFAWLHERYEFQAGVLKMQPHTCYDWHTDTRRGVGINQLLTPEVRSMCVFGPRHRLPQQQPTFEFQELVYQPRRYYVFNTQVLHTVYNFDQPRYLLSIEFAKNQHELSYAQLLEDITLNYELGAVSGRV